MLSSSSSSSKVAPRNQNNENAVGDHGQSTSTERGGHLVNDIESGDIEQGTAGRRDNTSFRRAQTFVAENKLNEQVESYGLAVLRSLT